MKKIINIYLLQEIIAPLSLSLLIFTFILLANKILRLTELVVNKGVALVDILKLIICILPSFLVFAIPMSLLLAILFALGRLSGDNEITALKASGLSIYQLLPSVMTVSLIAWLLTTLLTIYALPWGNRSFKNMFFNIIKNRAEVGFKEMVFIDYFPGLVIYINKIPAKGKKMEGILISDERMPDNPYTLVAREGCTISDDKSLTITFRLFDGSIHQTGKNSTSYQKINFKTYDFNFDLQSSQSKKVSEEKKRKEMTLKELRATIEKIKQRKGNFYPFAVEFHKKFSLPFACLIFGLLGIPLSVQPKGSGKTSSFALGLAIILVYYLILTGGETLGERGAIPPFLGMWAANILLGILGIYLLVKAARESPNKVLVFISDVITMARTKIGTQKEEERNDLFSSSFSLININTADREELVGIPGIGRKIAGEIIRRRTNNGNFSCLEQLKKVKGISNKKLEEIKEHITL